MPEYLNKNSYLIGQHRLVEQRKERKKIKNKLLFLFILVIFNLFLLLLLRSPYFAINYIQIDGLDKLSLEEIYSAAGIREGMNIWKISPPELRDRILQIPRVAGAEVERILPGGLHIFIREKYPLVLIPFHGYYLEVAGDGIIIGLRDDFLGELPLVSGLFWGKMDVGTNIPDRTRGEIVEIFLQVLSRLPALPLAEINVSDPQQIVVYTREGMEVWLGGSKDLEKKLNVLMHLYPRLPSLENNSLEGYLDLRAAEAPVFRPF
ncbi:MAG: FtsQ-type POTRA domain-containing protein [Bacillota bacterium]